MSAVNQAWPTQAIWPNARIIFTPFYIMPLSATPDNLDQPEKPESRVRRAGCKPQGQSFRCKDIDSRFLRLPLTPF
jgi:hypothetical protein